MNVSCDHDGFPPEPTDGTRTGEASQPGASAPHLIPEPHHPPIIASRRRSSRCLSAQSIAMKDQYYRFRDRSALVMLIGPGLLAIGMARAEAVMSQTANNLSYAPGLMTG